MWKIRGNFGDFSRICLYAGAARHIAEKFELQFHYIIITTSTHTKKLKLFARNNNNGRESLHPTMKWTHLLVTMLETIQILLLACWLQLAQILFLNQLFVFTTHCTLIFFEWSHRHSDNTFSQFVAWVMRVFFLSFFHSVFYYSITTIL